MYFLYTHIKLSFVFILSSAIHYWGSCSIFWLVISSSMCDVTLFVYICKKTSSQIIVLRNSHHNREELIAWFVPNLSEWDFDHQLRSLSLLHLKLFSSSNIVHVQPSPHQTFSSWRLLHLEHSPIPTSPLMQDREIK